MNQKFSFDVDKEIEKLTPPVANLANPANPSDPISRISRISKISRGGGAKIDFREPFSICYNSEKEKKVKLVNNNTAQVSQFSQVLHLSEPQNTNNEIGTSANTGVIIPDPKKDLIEQYFGKTRELTSEEDRMVDADEVMSYYGHLGFGIGMLNQVGGELWEEIRQSPEMVAAMAKIIRKRHNKPPTALCGIPIEELQREAGEDWEELVTEPDKLYAFADAISKQRLMEQGIVPDNYTAITHCEACGDVFVPLALGNHDGSVLGCPWCWNRAKGLSLPQARVGET